MLNPRTTYIRHGFVLGNHNALRHEAWSVSFFWYHKFQNLMLIPRNSKTKCLFHGLFLLGNTVWELAQGHETWWVSFFWYACLFLSSSKATSTKKEKIPPKKEEKRLENKRIKQQMNEWGRLQNLQMQILFFANWESNILLSMTRLLNLLSQREIGMRWSLTTVPAPL